MKKAVVSGQVNMEKAHEDAEDDYYDAAFVEQVEMHLNDDEYKKKWNVKNENGNGNDNDKEEEDDSRNEIVTQTTLDLLDEMKNKEKYGNEESTNLDAMNKEQATKIDIISPITEEDDHDAAIDATKKCGAAGAVGAGTSTKEEEEEDVTVHLTTKKENANTNANGEKRNLDIKNNVSASNTSNGGTSPSNNNNNETDSNNEKELKITYGNSTDYSDNENENSDEKKEMYERKTKESKYLTLKNDKTDTCELDGEFMGISYVNDNFDFDAATYSKILEDERKQAYDEHYNKVGITQDSTPSMWDLCCGGCCCSTTNRMK